MNQRKLDHEVKTLQVQAAQFAKQTGQWIGMVENFNQALKVGHSAHPCLCLSPHWLAAVITGSGLELMRTWGSQIFLLVSEKSERKKAGLGGVTQWHV